MHRINMSNINQNNEIVHIIKEISSLQDRLKINKKSLNQFQNGLMEIGRIQVKQGQKTNLSQTKKIQNLVNNIYQNKIKYIEKKANLLRNTLAHVKKERDYSKKD